MITAVRYALRPMTAADIPQIVDIERESFAALWPQTTYQRELDNKLARYLVAIDLEEASPAADESQAPWRDRMRRLIGVTPAAPPAERIAGFAGLWLLIDEAHLVTIAVRTSHRRRGIGEALFIAAAAAARDKGSQSLTLEVRRSNEAAQALYRKLGLREVGVRKRYYSDNNEDAVIMTAEAIQTPEFGELLRAARRAHGRRCGEMAS